MHLLIDTSAITRDKSGTGVYTWGMLTSLLENKRVEKVTAVGGYLQSLKEKHPQKLFHLFEGRTDWHVLLNRELAGNRPNIQADLALFPNYFIPPAFSIPSVVTIHDVSFLSHPQYYTMKMSYYYRQRIKHSINRAEAILTVSNSSKSQIVQYFPGKHSKIKVIRPGYHLAKGEIFNLYRKNKTTYFSDTTQKFLYLGTLEPRKNILAMIRGFKEANLRNAKLLLVGKTNASAYYGSKVKQQIATDSRIQFLGYQADQRVRKLLAQADGVVNLSKLEGFGFSLLEGLVSRTPCLISKDPALRELSGGEAISVNASSTRAIAGGFKALYEIKPGQLNGQTEKLKKTVTWQQFGRKLIDLLETVQSRRLPSMKSCRVSVHPIKQIILETLAYSAVFNAPIEKHHLFNSLGEKVDQRAFEKHLGQLTEQYPRLVKKEDEFYSLHPWSRSGRAYISEKNKNDYFIKKHRRMLHRLNRLPWVEGIYFSGGSVHGSQLEKRDLDLFIVTASNRVWLVYTLFKVISKCFDRNSVLCYNYLVDRNAMHIHYQQDFFSAHQLLFLKPVFDKGDYPNVLQHNGWIRKYFPNKQIKFQAEKSTPGTTKSSGSNGKSLGSNSGTLWNPINLINLFLMACFSVIWYIKGLQNTKGGLLWDVHRIKLHTNDHRPWIYKRFYEIMKKIKIKINY